MALLVFDKDGAMDRVGEDLDLLKELFVVFFEDYDGLLDQLKEGAEKKDSTALEHTAHTLKGALLNLGANAAADVARKIEFAARDSELRDVESMVNSFNEAMSVFKEEVSSFR